MNTLGIIELPVGMLWSESGQSQGRRSVLRTALDGSAVVFGSAGPRRITLLAGDDACWVPEATALQLLALAESEAGTTLTWSDHLRPEDSYTVAFDHESAAAVQLEPLWPGSDLYTGRIALILL